jgi:hypothetical protein
VNKQDKGKINSNILLNKLNAAQLYSSLQYDQPSVTVKVDLLESLPITLPKL